MRKFYRTILSLAAVAGVFTACDDEETVYIPQEVIVTDTVEIVRAEPPLVSISQDVYNMELTDSLVLRASAAGDSETTYRWTVDSAEVSTDSVYVFKTDHSGLFSLSVTVTNAEGEATANASVNVRPGKYKHGTFVLSEGSTQPARLTFIDEEGNVTADAYNEENGGSLGSVPQDLFIHNHKLYVVAQNGGNEGKNLTVLNAETLKQEAAYDLSLSWPTHVAVLGDDEIYIRSNGGVHVFRPSTEELTAIEGTSGARKNAMAVAQGKVFATVGKTVVVIEQGRTAISATIEFTGNVSGLLKSSDGNLWVSTADKKISKVDAQTYEIIDTHDVSDVVAGSQLAASYAASPSITAKGDTLYMSGLTSTIYRHVFSTGETTLMADAKDYVDNCGIIYNTCAVHPRTGEVVLNSIKGYGTSYLTNNITFFDFSGETPAVSANYEGHTRFPAGTFFTSNFE